MFSWPKTGVIFCMPPIVFVILFIHLVGDWPSTLHVSGSGRAFIAPVAAQENKYPAVLCPAQQSSTYFFLATATWTRGCTFYLILIGLKWIDVWRNILCLVNRWDSSRHGGCNCQNETLVGGNLSDDLTNTKARVHVNSNVRMLTEPLSSWKEYITNMSY